MNRITKVYLLVFYLFLSYSFLIAQSGSSESKFGSIKGKITADDDNQPLVFTNIILKGTSLGAATDLDGNYLIRNIPAGKYEIIASYLGYEKKIVKITVSGNKTLQLDLALTPLSIEGLEVTVTAQASGQMDAINEQISSNSIINVVSSARIQELPDANAAESVGRLPGVSINRSGGEGNKVIIRGLSPKFNSITVNGVKMAATGSGDRSTDISMISPYMLQGIEVTKAITPDMDADVIGGSVNFKIKEAAKGLKFDVIAQGGYNGLQDSYGDYKFVFIGSNRFLDNKFGVFAQVNVENKTRSADQLKATYDIDNPSLIKWDPIFATDANFDKITRERERYGSSLVLDYKFDNGSIILSNFGSKSITDIKRQTESFRAEDNIHDYQIADNEIELSVISNTLDFNYDFGIFRFDALLANSFSENKSPLNISLQFRELGAFTATSGFVDPFSIVDSATNNISNTYIRNLSANSSYNKENHFTAAANIEFDLNFSNQITSKIKFGGKYRHQYRYNNEEVLFRNFTPHINAKQAVYDVFPWMNNVDIGTSNRSLVPFSLFFDSDPDTREYLDGQFRYGPVADYELLHELYNYFSITPDGVYPGNLLFKNHEKSIRNDYHGSEDYSAGFIMAEINVGNSLMLLPGIRYEHNITTYTDSRGDNSEQANRDYIHEIVTETRKNDFWLPMFHVRYKPTSWLNLRFAYTKTLTRPNYNQISPNYHLDVDKNAISFNNFLLKPGRATNYDFSIAILDNYVGLFTASLFYKKIDDLIYNPGAIRSRDTELAMSEFHLPAEVANVQEISTMINSKNAAIIKGIELDWQTYFWYLPKPFNGLILNINYTYIKSETEYPFTLQPLDSIGVRTVGSRKLTIYGPVRKDTSYSDRIIDQPTDIINISMGYDYKGFSTRISMIYNDNIFSGTDINEEQRANTDAYTRWDLAIKQKLPLEGLQIYFNLNNFTSTVDKEFIANNSAVSREEHYGMTMDLGIRYKF